MRIPLLLLLLLPACGQPTYRMVGEAQPGPALPAAVTLLDSTAAAFVDSMLVDYEERLAALANRSAARRDSIESAGDALGGPLREARSRHEAARRRYLAAFEGATHYLSFGGNPILTPEDARTPTEDLLASVANRLHRGKAFSLESETMLRQYIREQLAPREREMLRAAEEVTRLQRQVQGQGRAVGAAAAEYTADSTSLAREVNEAVKLGIEARAFARAAVDSVGRFTFEGLSPGTYIVYAEGPLPDAWMEPMSVEGHRHVRLLPDRRRRVRIVAEGGQ